MPLFYAAFFPGPFSELVFQKRKCSSWEQSQGTVLQICVWQKKKKKNRCRHCYPAQQLLGWLLSRQRAPHRASLFTLVRVTGPDTGHCAVDNWAKIPTPVTQKLLSGATLPRHKGTSLVPRLFNMAQLAWGSLNPVLYKWEAPLISNWFCLVLNQRERGCPQREISGHFQKAAPNWFTATP